MRFQAPRGFLHNFLLFFFFAPQSTPTAPLEAGATRTTHDKELHWGVSSYFLHRPGFWDMRAKRGLFTPRPPRPPGPEDLSFEFLGS